MCPPFSSLSVSYLSDLRQHKDSLIRGATLVLGGAALLVAGTLIGLGAGKLYAVVAGTLGVAGVIVIFLGFCMYVVPPLLPAK